MKCIKCGTELGTRGEKGVLLKGNNVCCPCWIKQDREKRK